MSMILTSTWGVVISDSQLTRRGLRNMVYGALLSFLAGMAVGGILGLLSSQFGAEEASLVEPGVLLTCWGKQCLNC
jgi:hypothetical protein